jgi:hypothetical protein
MQQSGGLLRQPVQKLVATLMKRIPLSTHGFGHLSDSWENPKSSAAYYSVFD